VKQLEDRVAVVTGAASGIGLAIAECLVAAGAKVVLTDVDEPALERVVMAMRDHGSGVEAVHLDVRDAAAVDRLAGRIVEQFGALHIAVNNAGIVNGGLAWELPLEEWHRVLDVNLWGVIHGVRSFVPRILRNGDEGHVVNVASIAAVLPQRRLGPYTVAKHGVLGLSDVLRSDLQKVGADVGVSVVMPGMIRTGMNPIGTVEPSAVAANVIDAIRNNRPYVFTDDHATKEVRDRLEAIIAARDGVIGP
jgi:NAD(P)-dependent dehydrogenase (short-subunit alcohol dehydrogenase family)